MAGEQWTFGIQKVLSGDPGVDGALGASLTEHGETLKGSATLETTDESINWIETEEKGKRKAISMNDSETTLSFEVANPSLETQAYYLGGTVEEDPVNGDSYSPPKTKTPINRSFVIETLEGYDIEIPYGAVTATPIGGQIGTENVLTLRVRVTAQEPEAEGVGFITYREKM